MTQIVSPARFPWMPEEGNPCQAVRGLIHQAVRSRATRVEVQLSPTSITIGHNGQVPLSAHAFFQVVGVPIGLGIAQHDLLSLLNPLWSAQVTLTTPTWGALLVPGSEGVKVQERPGKPALKGVWMEVQGSNLDSVTAEWVIHSLGFTDVELHINGEVQPAPQQGLVVLHGDLMDVHLYPVHPHSPTVAHMRSLGQGWHALHVNGESRTLFDSVWPEAFRMVEGLVPAELKHLKPRVHVVVKGPPPQVLYCGEAGEHLPLQLREGVLHAKLAELLVDLPDALNRVLSGVLHDMQDGLGRQDFWKLCQEHHVPTSWAEVALMMHGWRECPVILARGDRPEVQNTWRHQPWTSSNPQEVLLQNLLVTLEGTGRWCAMAQANETPSLPTNLLPLSLAGGRITVTDHQRIRRILQDPGSKGHLLMNISGLVLNPTDTFFHQAADLATAEMLLQTVVF